MTDDPEQPESGIFRRLSPPPGVDLVAVQDCDGGAAVLLGSVEVVEGADPGLYSPFIAPSSSPSTTCV